MLRCLECFNWCWQHEADVVPYQNLKLKNDQFESLNTLLLLNDDCLRDICDRLDIESLCEIAAVCKRLQSIAEGTFRRRYCKLNYKKLEFQRSLLRRVLCKFGHLVTSIDDDFCILRRKEGIDVYAIAIYCKNLKSLTIRGAKINCTVAKPMFERLKYLKLVWCEFIGADKDILFTKCRKLESLSICHARESCEFIAKKFRKLVYLKFDTSVAEDTTLLELILLNPKLQQLYIPIANDDCYISTVANYTKNVHHLQIEPGIQSSVNTNKQCTKGVFVQLSQLKNLKTFVMKANTDIHSNSVATLMNAFSEENTPIEHLYLDHFSINSVDLQSMTDSKTMVFLRLHEIKSFAPEDLVALVADLPLLTCLVLHFAYNIQHLVTIDLISDIVESGRQLKFLILNGVRNLFANQKAFDSLGEFTKRCLKEKLIYIQFRD